MKEPLFSRLLGLETEYGLLVDGCGAGDLMEESRLLVAACPFPHVVGWDYAREEPRRDLRGFSVDRLNHDAEDARLDRGGPPRRLSSAEQRADRVLTNGARLYNDHGHPEYATPECRSLRDLLAHDRAGERIALACAARREAVTGRRTRLFKNNTDFHGASFGCHESYLTWRDLPFSALLQGMVPFLVTRILFAGAGKTCVETDDPRSSACDFQLAQRADFFTEEASVDTLARRPVFNTRDEPHADPTRFRRLHVICGDANLSQFATALKVGTTSLVLSVLESGWVPAFELRDAPAGLRRLSRDPTMEWVVDLSGGRSMRAVDLQRVYLLEAERVCRGRCGELDRVLDDWQAVLDALERDPFTLADRLDWVAKRSLLEQFAASEGAEWDDPVMRSLDLEYHDVDPAVGLFYAMEQEGLIRTLVDEEAVRQAMADPPEETRAALRGDLTARWGEAIAVQSWGRVRLGDRWVELPAELDRTAVGCLRTRLCGAKTVREAVEILAGDGGDQDASNQR